MRDSLVFRVLTWQIQQIFEYFIHEKEDYKEEKEKTPLQNFLNSLGKVAGSKPDPTLNTAVGMRFEFEANAAPSPLHLLITIRDLHLYIC